MLPTIRIRSGADLIRLRAALADMAPVLDEAGRLAVAQARRAFREQRLDSAVWPPRYPSQADPFVNVAGAVEDFNAGRRAPIANRFARTPALRVTGRLVGSIAYQRTGPNSMETGSTVPYASVHQFGGKTTQTLTTLGRQNLAKFLKSKKGKPYRKRLGFLFSFPTLETTVNARPFLGMTTQLREDIERTLTRHLVGPRSSGRAS